MTSIIYVLRNLGMPGLLKIGRTDRDDPARRMEELYTTGVPFPFECVKAIEVKATKNLEKVLHRAFHPYRVNPGREFFRLDEDQVVAILESWPDGRDVTEPTNAKSDEEVPKEDVAARERERKRRRPNLDFSDLDIQEGEPLVFTNPSGDRLEAIEAIVVGPKKVRFEDEEMFLTRATNRALGNDDREPIRPAPYWSYEGKLLSDLYEEVYGD